VLGGFAAGYVLGGGLTPRLTWMALATFGRVSAINVLRDLVAEVAGGPGRRPARVRASGPARATRS
jgi:hypothetical protein